MTFSVKKVLEPRNFATLLLVLFCIRYIPLESRAGPSMIKTFVSAICVIYLLTKATYFSKAVLWCSAFFGMIFVSAVLHPESFRWSTLLYLLSFLFAYICFYNLVWCNCVYTLPKFIKVVKYLIYAYVIVLIIQQAFILAGLRIFPLINLCQFLDRGVGTNSLSGEPSTEARILTVLVYAFIKCNQYRKGSILSIKDMFDSENRWVTIGYLYAVMTMGSGTAFLCIAILSLYFLRFRYAFLVIPLYIGAYLVLSNSDNESFKRVVAAVEATVTGDTDEVTKTDTSAATRINPLLNTIQNLDLSDSETWLGHGIDWSNRSDIRRSSQRYVGEIGDYGFIAYLLGLGLVFGCAIIPVSLATIMFFLGVGGGTGNIAYFWGILMVFTVVKYFYSNLDNPDIYVDEDVEEEEEVEESTAVVQDK